MRVADIIKEYLKERGYDGLAGDYCGCSLDDLMACGLEKGDCCPAYLCKEPKCGRWSREEFDEIFCTTKQSECKEAPDEAE